MRVQYVSRRSGAEASNALSNSASFRFLPVVIVRLDLAGRLDAYGMFSTCLGCLSGVLRLGGSRSEGGFHSGDPRVFQPGDAPCVDPQQHLDAVPGPGGDLCGRDAGVQPPSGAPQGARRSPHEPLYGGESFVLLAPSREPMSIWLESAVIGGGLPSGSRPGPAPPDWVQALVLGSVKP